MSSDLLAMTVAAKRQGKRKAKARRGHVVRKKSIRKTANSVPKVRPPGYKPGGISVRTLSASGVMECWAVVPRADLHSR